MYSVTRNRETIFAEYIFTHHPDFKDVPQYYSRYSAFHIEGGDILNINEHVLAIGISQRTEPDAIDEIAHNIFCLLYTSSVGYLNDFIKKVERARDIKGTRFIHVMAPCPVGWGFPSADMVDVAREIVDTGLWYLAEYEGPALTGAPGGTFHLNRDPKSFKPIEPYLRRQGRFSADDGADLALIERARDERWSYMRETWG